MTPPFNFLVALILPAFMAIASFATPVINRSIVPAIHSNEDVSARTANTCADPSLANTVFEAFSGQTLTHFLDFHYAFVNTDSKSPAGATLWSFQGPMFKAWPTQQPFTFPLWYLATPSASEYIFLVGVDASTPPIASGFNAKAIVAWVYNTAVCDSVPLMSLVLASASDHYYTTDPFEHAGLLADGGWTDGGVIAYVLPLAT